MSDFCAEQEQWDGALEDNRVAPEYPDYDRLHENDGVPFTVRETGIDMEAGQ